MKKFVPKYTLAIVLCVAILFSCFLNNIAYASKVATEDNELQNSQKIKTDLKKELQSLSNDVRTAGYDGTGVNIGIVGLMTRGTYVLSEIGKRDIR